MARPPRCRRIGGYPDHWSFSPEEDGRPAEEEILLLDEFEAIRLIDREGLTQEQAAERMGVARTTVTAIYDSARRKLARVIVDRYRDGTKMVSADSYKITPGVRASFSEEYKQLDEDLAACCRRDVRVLVLDDTNHEFYCL